MILSWMLSTSPTFLFLLSGALLAAYGAARLVRRGRQLLLPRRSPAAH